MVDNSWKRPPEGFRYRQNSPAGHVERAIAAIRQHSTRRIILVVAVAAALLATIMR